MLSAIFGYASFAHIIEAYASMASTGKGRIRDVAVDDAVVTGLLNELHTRETLAPNAATRLAATIDDDFKQGRVRLVDGWLLSQTELALCLTIAKMQEAA